MPTTYQAKVKMIPKTKPSPASTESVALTATSGKDTLVTRAKAPQLRAVNLIGLSQANTAPETRVLSASIRDPGSLSYRITKRAFDLIAGFILLLVAIPLILIAAVIIRVETKGSPFFVQTRLGKRGKPFKIFKLRGMYIDARVRFASYYDYSQHQDLEFCFHHEEDPRVTRAGKFIRRTSIDELPNLWNVVLGDMSLVGPRPEIPEVLALYGPYREEYLSVKPGVTCLSKCTGRDRLTKKETIEFDLEYIRTRCFKKDITVLWETFRGVLLRRDVY